jgi:hypothetical protein
MNLEKSRKFLSVVLFLAIIVLPTTSFATWTLVPSKVSKAANYLKWKLVCTSDGDAMAATDLLALSNMPSRLKGEIQGSSLMSMKVSPGTGGVAPDTTINITLSDDEQDALWPKAAISNTAISWHLTSSDISIYVPIFGSFYLEFANDIGAAGDQVTLYFIMWIE